MKLINVLIVIGCCVFAWVLASAQIQHIDHIGGPCVPQPYEANAWDWKTFNDEQKAELKAYTDYLERAMFEEIYLRFCSLRDNDKTGDCNLLWTDTIQACTWPDTCDISDPWFTGVTPTVTINTGVLELLAKPIDDAHNLWSCMPTDKEKYLESPYLRFRGFGGDSLDITFSGTGDSTDSPHSTVIYLPDQAYQGNTMWMFSGGAGDTTGTNRTVYLGHSYPYPGLVQGGVAEDINTNMTRDTIVFATAYSNSHGGDSEGGGTAYIDGGPLGPHGNNRWYHSGYRYNTTNGAHDVSVIVSWADQSGAYFGDSLWVVSVTDSSFVIGIEYSATSRRMSWQTIGKWKEDYF